MPDTRTAAPAISVVVPSWRRPADLERCLRALAGQSERPLEVVVGAREGDGDTLRVVAAVAADTGLRVSPAVTPAAGVIAAMQAAADRCAGEVVALTDDDAEPRADWIERLGAAFADRRVGAVGGRDWQPWERGDRAVVGLVQPFGRVIGRHHLGAGPARDVDHLKGANMAVRASLLRVIGFDARLRGAGAQMYWELALCLPIRRAGWRVVYDPAIAVEHHIAPRHDADQRHRGVFSAEPHVDAVHNQTLVLLEHLGAAGRAAFRAWAALIGTRDEPGLAQLPRLLLAGQADVLARWRATRRGRADGWRAYIAARARGATPVPAPPA
jgi:GT2 family glycosyltransferase